MGIRSEIKAVIREQSGNLIGALAAVNAISNIVNRPKPPKPAPSRAALAEEAIAAAQEHVDETGLRGRQHPLLIVTLTHFCDEGAIKAKVDHDEKPDEVLVALAIATLQQFAVEKFGKQVEVPLITDVAEILKKI